MYETFCLELSKLSQVELNFFAIVPHEKVRTDEKAIRSIAFLQRLEARVVIGGQFVTYI